MIVGFTQFNAKRPYGKKSDVVESLRRSVLFTAKCPHGVVSTRRNVLTTKCPYGEMSMRRNVLVYVTSL